MTDHGHSARKTLEVAVTDLAVDGKSAEAAARYVAAQVPEMDANEARRFAAKARREAEISSREARISLWIADFIADAERMSGRRPITLREAATVLAVSGNEAAADIIAMIGTAETGESGREDDT